MKYACIMQYRQQFPVARMCRVLGVSCSGLYASQQRPVGQRAHADQRLRLEIRMIHQRSRTTYGSPRIHAELRAQGVRCSLPSMISYCPCMQDHKHRSKGRGAQAGFVQYYPPTPKT